MKHNNIVSQNSSPPEIRIHPDSIQEIISPTPFHIWSLIITVAVPLLLASGFAWFLKYTNTLKRRLPVDTRKMSYTLAKTETEKFLLKKLGDLSIKYDYGTYGDVGRLKQFTFDAHVYDYRTYKRAIVEAEIVGEEWFEKTWDVYFEVESIVSTSILFLVQTSLIAGITKRQLPLTIVRNYYSVAFEWLQELGFNENSNFLYPETFDELEGMLKHICLIKIYRSYVIFMRFLMTRVITTNIYYGTVLRSKK